MRSRIWRSMALTTLLAVAVFAVLSMAALYRFFTAQTEGALDDEARVIIAALEGGADIEALSEANPDTRVTRVAADGAVLYDSQADAGQMENHLERPEIAEALESGIGGSVRYSDTLGEATIYRALRMQDGSVLRISGTQ